MTLLPHENYYQEGYQFAFENAKSLSKIAKISASENEFGIACSLSILSAEESIKAIFLLFKHLDVQIEIEGFEKIFRDHKIKHHYYPETSKVFQIFVEIFYTEDGIYTYIVEMLERLMPETQIKPFLEKHNAIIDVLKKINLLPDVKINKSPKINVTQEKKWWSKANLLKNRGLYVDKLDKGWHDPKRITKEKYQEVLAHTHYIIENTENILNILTKGKKGKV